MQSMFEIMDKVATRISYIRLSAENNRFEREYYYILCEWEQLADLLNLYAICQLSS